MNSSVCGDFLVSQTSNSPLNFTPSSLNVSRTVAAVPTSSGWPKPCEKYVFAARTTAGSSPSAKITRLGSLLTFSNVDWSQPLTGSRRPFSRAT